MTVWLSSDTHLGHALVANLRAFSSVRQHDEAILRNLQRHIQPEDTLWILGDMALGGWAETIKPLSQLPFTVHAILGNHDRPHPHMSNHATHLAKFQELGGFASVQTEAFIEFDGETFLLSHFSITGDHGEDRFVSFRPADTGMTVIHGHTHANTRVTYSPVGTKQIHVGLDAWGLHPVRLSDAVRAA